MLTYKIQNFFNTTCGSLGIRGFHLFKTQFKSKVIQPKYFVVPTYLTANTRETPAADIFRRLVISHTEVGGVCIIITICRLDHCTAAETMVHKSREGGNTRWRETFHSSNGSSDVFSPSLRRRRIKFKKFNSLKTKHSAARVKFHEFKKIYPNS